MMMRGLLELLERSSLMKIIGELLEVIRLKPLILNGGWSNYDKQNERKFIKTYRGFDIYSMYGQHSETIYRTGIASENCFASGENYYGKGFFIFAVDSNGIYSDGSVEVSYWVRVKSSGMNPSVNSESLVKKGIKKAMRKVEKYLDWSIAYIEKLNKQDDRENHLETKVVDSVNMEISHDPPAPEQPSAHKRRQP